MQNLHLPEDQKKKSLVNPRTGVIEIKSLHPFIQFTVPKKSKKIKYVYIRFSNKEKVKVEEKWSEELHSWIRPKTNYEKQDKMFDYELWLEKYLKHIQNEKNRKNTNIS